MEKTKLAKVFLVIMVALALVLVSTQTFADNNTIDITNSLNGNSSGNSNGNTNSNTNTNTNSNTNTNVNTNTNTNTKTSSYNNTNLPTTGIAESGSTIAIVFALAVSAVYAYKKIRDYNNI